ncbi:MAG: ExbD/TolR family protein [Chitinophagales bacterium]
MGRINKKKKETPEISTASLPDIIFILLFFFMVVTVMRKNDLLLKVDTPKATELSKIKYKEATAYVFIGEPTDKNRDVYGTKPRIQLNDAIRPKSAVQPYIKEIYGLVPDGLKGQFIVSLRVDKDVTMGIVTDVKQELRKADALKINYSTKVKAVE